MSFPIADVLFPTSDQVVSNPTLTRLVSKVALVNPCIANCQDIVSICLKDAGSDENKVLQCYNNYRSCTVKCLQNQSQKIVSSRQVVNEPIASIQLDVSNPNLPFFIFEILDDSIFQNINIDNMTDYAIFKEGFIIRAIDSKNPNISLKLVLTNPKNDTESLRLQLIVRKTKISKNCIKCVKELVNIQLIGQL